MSSIEIRQHQPGKDLEDFIRVPHMLLAGDPAFVPQLDMMVRGQLTPKQNPFFAHADVALFTAYRGGKLVGRISAQIDHEHQARYADAVGFFGYFDTIDDREVAQALLDTARRWLADRGMKRMRGPLSMSINEEVGVLVEGFETPAALLMGHHTRYQAGLIEASGFTKIKDVLAWRYRVTELPERARKARAEVAAMPEVRLRIVDKTRFDEEMAHVLAIQDDAWHDNWGHVSLTAAEGKALIQALKLLIEPELAIFAEINGEVAAMALALPNLPEAVADLGGKLLPFGWAKLLYRLRVQKLKSARLFLLGIRKQYRTQRRYGGLALALVAEIQERGRRIGMEWGELSWTLEDNTPVNLLIRTMRGEAYKKYRVFERAIDDAG
ncbi:MAG: hypothetical protein ABW321_06845 [Polyangiales bacterium]